MFRIKNIALGFVLALVVTVTILFTKEGAEIFIYNVF